ncbi:prepilin-type N-terminal cleavage/methylation domain-containing protein [candidate division TA06 bacterium]|uniref:Prepilin-type N-terminal cleavage/methylation domain-containing protein n=1 Tax=candidate division TA06 bacterium TaxID=2250710 RepID=A0A933ICW6_UNCT6|nr:prepilin-type N-terminal cleavage/methylation domain-containing protein [candidate division TA06 bacterium]
MKRKGFTLIELMVAVTVLGIVMAAIMVVVNNANRAKRDNDLVMEAQQQARAGLDMVVRDVRTIGYDIPFAGSQLRVVYARPFECIFNSNISPYPDSQNIRQQPLCYDPAISPTCPNALNIAVFFTTGAETYRYTIDSDNDGDYFSGADKSDDAIERGTTNPNDYVLVRQAYGKMISGTYSGTNNIYPALNQPVALIRGPANSTDYTVEPLFQYWYRPAGSDTLRLYGDANGDKTLTGAERNFANPSADILASIEEITTTVTAETRNQIRGVYRQVVVTTRTNLNNVPISSTRYTVSGSYTYPEAGSSPVPDANVYISSGTMQTTNSAGAYSFTVDPGTYTVTPEKLIDGTGYYYLLRHPQDTLADASSASVANLNFKYEAIPDGEMCHITGEVYNDTIAPIGLPAMPTAGERRIGGVTVTATGFSSIAGTESTIISVSKITNSSGQYELIVPIGTYTVTEYDSAGYFSTTPNDTVITMAAIGTTITKNFGDTKLPGGFIKITVWADTNKNFLQNAGEPLIPNVKCYVTRGGAQDIPVANGLTDANGQVLLQVPADTVLSIIEVDLDSMYSTCAIRLGYTAGLDSANYDTLKPRSRLDSIIVLRDSTYRVKFGDVTGFVTLNLGTTERVLSLITPNLGETVDPPGSNDNSYGNDPDLVLGTVSGGTSNLYVWYNRYKSATTSFNSIFPSGGGGVAVPDRSIDLGNDICAITAANFNPNVSSDYGTSDLVCGLGKNATSNIKWEPSVDGNPAKNQGDLTAFIGFATATEVLNTDVTSADAAIIVNDTTCDFVIGTNDNVNQGHLEVWRNYRTKNVTPQFVRDSAYYKADFAGTVDFGEIRTIVLADVVDSLGTGTGAGSKDGLLDIIVGTKTSGTWPNYSGQLVILRRAGQQKRFVVDTCVATAGAYINAIATYNHGNYKDLAIGFRLPGATSTDYAGALSLLHNNANGTFTQTAKVAIAGEVTSVATGRIDIDNIPDVVCGVKTGLNTGKTLVFYQSPTDYLPSSGNDPSGGAFGGEVIAVRTVAFRPVPGKTDIVVGERFDQSGVSKGRIVIYFNKN